jgi:phytanoyl-CoA hydroxylase
MVYLTEEQVTFFHDNGYLVVEDFWPEDTQVEMRSRIDHYVNSADLAAVKSVFATKEQVRKSDDYFLTSGPEIRFFWEEKAWDQDGNFVAASPSLGINKVGHALHDLDPTFERCSYDGRVGSSCAQLGLQHPMLVQSMYIFKQPKIGGEVGAHQDGAFLYTEPQTCIGFWWALDDCSLENGCLWAVPGSHKLGVHRRFRRRDPPHDGGTEFVPVDPIQWDLTNAVPLPTKKGTLVILHNALVHYSAENTSDKPRHAYAIHIVDGREGVVYPNDNWLQRPEEFPFREITNRV